MRKNSLTEKILQRGIRGHVALYRLLKGSGPLGKNTILVTTTGRKSGQPRTKPLATGKDGDNFVIIASYGGAEKHPDWYVNLKNNPQVTVEDHGRVVSTIASTVTDEAEYKRLWSLMTSIYPNYNDYQRKTQRTIPVVILTPIK
jgi:deazaflavin-dependent oxidoreductase (nitroreductase family)